jgi:hypothetical protein
MKLDIWHRAQGLKRGFKGTNTIKVIRREDVTT